MQINIAFLKFCPDKLILVVILRVWKAAIKFEEQLWILEKDTAQSSSDVTDFIAI